VTTSKQPPKVPRDRPAVAVLGLARGGESITHGVAWLDENNMVKCTAAWLLDTWCEEGILGRHTEGRLFPKDGQRFLNELPYAYRGGYHRAQILRGPGAET
jgi:hypothetical protein